MISLSPRICGCYLQIDTPEAVIRTGVGFDLGKKNRSDKAALYQLIPDPISIGDMMVDPYFVLFPEIKLLF